VTLASANPDISLGRNLNALHDPDHVPLRVICPRYAGTLYSLPVYNSWSF